MFKKLAKIKYLPNNFQVVELGDYVVCAVSGKKINIESGSQPDMSKDIKKDYINFLKIHYKNNKYWLLNKIKSIKDRIKS